VIWIAMGDDLTKEVIRRSAQLTRYQCDIIPDLLSVFLRDDLLKLRLDLRPQQRYVTAI